jgi:hypothetical protein
MAKELVKGFRVDEAEAEALARAAASEDRAEGYIVRRVLVDWLRSKGWLKQDAAE